MDGVILSVCYTFYKNPGMLRRNLMVWRDEWSVNLKASIELILIDDCSPSPDTAAEVLGSMWGGDRTGLPSLSLYRVTIDRPWGQHPARNLASHVAKGRWLFHTDQDHILPASTLSEVLRLLPTLGNNEVLTFGRVDAPATLTWKADHWPEFERTRRRDGSLKGHVNSFCVSRERYWNLRGYDEDFQGYGTDSQFRRKLFGPGSTTHHLDHAPLIRVDRNVIPDASTTTYSRETQRCNVRAVLARKAAEGRSGKTTTLNFPWERVL